MPSNTVQVNFDFPPPQPMIQTNGDLLASSSTIGNQWFLNGEPIMDATGQFYTATENGFYTVQVTINGCSSTPSSIHNHTLVSLENLKDDQALLLFPNPSTDLVNIEFADQREASFPIIDLYNSSGQLVKQFQNTNQISLRSLAKGLYFLRIVNDQGTGGFTAPLLKM